MTREEFLRRNENLMHDRAGHEGAYERAKAHLNSLDKNQKDYTDKVKQQEKEVKVLKAQIDRVQAEMKSNSSKYAHDLSKQRSEKLKNVGQTIVILANLHGLISGGIDQYRIVNPQEVNKCVSEQQFKKEKVKKEFEKIQKDLESLQEAKEMEKERQREREEREQKQREFRENMERKRKERNGYER